MFNKDEYWKRRNGTGSTSKLGVGVVSENRQRGQGDYPKLSRIAIWTKEDHAAGKCNKDEVGKPREPRNMQYRMDRKQGLVPYPRRDRRQKIVIREYTKRGFNGHTPNPSKNPKTTFPIYDPAATNHHRHVARRIQNEQLAKMKAAK